MTDQQLYLAIGLPILAVLVGVLMNAVWFVALNGRVQALESRLDARFDRLESAFMSKMDILTGKVVEIDNRLTRVEEQLKHLH